MGRGENKTMIFKIPKEKGRKAYKMKDYMIIAKSKKSAKKDLQRFLKKE
jgi:hypothetical protein